jgi:hypothetical protein
MAIQLRRAGRLRAGFGVEVRGHDPHIRFGHQRTQIVWVLPSVEEDQVACVRPDNRAIPFHRIDIEGRRRTFCACFPGQLEEAASVHLV